MACAAAGAVPLVPLVLANAHHAAHFWTHRETLPVGKLYLFLLGTLPTGRMLYAAYLLALFVVIDLVRRVRGHRPARRIEPHELAAGAALIALPAIGLLVAGGTTGIVTTRYFLFTITGLMVALPLAAWRFTPAGVPEIVLCVALCSSFVTSTGRVPPGRVLPIDEAAVQSSLWTTTIAEGGPVVLTGGGGYLQHWYYAPAERRADVMYLASPVAELGETGTDTIDRGHLALARWTSLPVFPLAAFLETHREFRLYDAGEDWILSDLRARGASFEEIGREGDAHLLIVRLPVR
jgi:hypothetical protein